MTVLENFIYYSIKITEALLKSTNNIWFNGELQKVVQELSYVTLKFLP